MYLVQTHKGHILKVATEQRHLDDARPIHVSTMAGKQTYVNRGQIRSYTACHATVNQLDLNIYSGYVHFINKLIN